MDFVALRVTLLLAFSTTLILLVVGLPVSYWLTVSRTRLKWLIEVVIAIPLVLPPTVLGLYLLIFLSPTGFLGGAILEWTGQRIPFTFAGLLIGSVIFNLPLSIRPFIAAFSSVPRSMLEASWCMGEGSFQTMRRVALPIAWPGVLAGMAITFANTVGEFGVVMMLGGNIDGSTRTLSVALYDDVQSLNYGDAHWTAVVMVALSLVSLGIAQWGGSSKWLARPDEKRGHE